MSMKFDMDLHFENPSRKLKIYYYIEKTSTLHENQYTILIINRTPPRRMRKVLVIFTEKFKTHTSYKITIFQKIVHVRYYVQ